MDPKMAALQQMRGTARKARNPNAADRDQLMIAIGLGKPVTTPEEDDAIARLGDPSARGPLGESTPPNPQPSQGEPDGDEASQLTDELMSGTDISALGRPSSALHEAGTGGVGDDDEDDES